MKNSIARFLLKIIKAKTSAFIDNGTIFSGQSQHLKARRNTQTVLYFNIQFWKLPRVTGCMG